jgi:hypothetical protein
MKDNMKCYAIPLVTPDFLLISSSHNPKLNVMPAPLRQLIIVTFFGLKGQLSFSIVSFG